jgi:hypothetical protein
VLCVSDLCLLNSTCDVLADHVHTRWASLSRLLTDRTQISAHQGYPTCPIVHSIMRFEVSIAVTMKNVVF